MKKYIYTLIAAALLFAGCSNDQEPSVLATELEAPQISRAAGSTITSATIAGFSVSGDRVFQRDLSFNGTEWVWGSGTSSLTDVEELVCVVPAQSSRLGTRTYYSPSKDAMLVWERKHVDHQAEDDRFYFNNLQHCLAQMCIVTDRYYSLDDLMVKLSLSGYFNYFEGKFVSLSSPTNKYIYPTKNDDGTYTYTFSIVPQTFQKGATLLTYRDVYSDGYYTYTHKLTEDVTVKPNQRFTVRMEWNTDDWSDGGYTETITYVSTSITVADWTINETIEGEATENN